MNTNEMKANGWTERKITGITALEYGESSNCIRVTATPMRNGLYRVSNVENAKVEEFWDFATLDEALAAADAKRVEFFE